MTHSFETWLIHLWHDSFICDIITCTDWYRYVDCCSTRVCTFICDMIHSCCDMTHSSSIHEWHYSLTHSCYDMTHWRSWHDSLIPIYKAIIFFERRVYGSWLINAGTWTATQRGSAHSYYTWLFRLWRDSFVVLYVTWLIHVGVMTH